MNLYQVKTRIAGEERLTLFVEEHFVAAGYGQTGDLSEVQAAEIAFLLASSCRLSGRELASAVDELSMFASGMQDGDLVLIDGGDWVYLGDIGDYFYVEHAEEELRHRRGVTWLARIARERLNATVLDLLNAVQHCSMFELPLAHAQLEEWLPMQVLEEQGLQKPSAGQQLIDDDTLAEAVAVLKEALKSASPKRRERAAIALLRYAKRGH